ncbi:hypothetical protein J2790_003291 [Paenarthrobacter nicotinovorans]|nr:hypothetical protein [Paenarthrobacter nicotinovorans]
MARPAGEILLALRFLEASLGQYVKTLEEVV